MSQPAGIDQTAPRSNEYVTRHDARSGEELLRLDRVTFNYPNGTEVLREISLTIDQGTNIAVIGPSGCGKSTLLNLLARLAQPTTGNVWWNRVSSAADHPLSMVFQKDTLLPWLTVRKNVGVSYRYQKQNKSRREERDRIDALLRLGGLTDSADRYPYQLSGGMRRRTQFLAAVAPNPGVLLLDEPFSSLDEPTRVGLHQDVLRISRDLNMSLLLVTHDLAEAISLSDEIVVLTQRPASIFSRHVMPFGRERDVRTLRADPQFLSLYGQIWEELNEQIMGRTTS